LNPSDSDLTKYRQEKLDKLHELGIDPYPARSPQAESTRVLLDNFDALAEQAAAHTIMGRLLALRLHGKTAFADLGDQEGRLQVYFKLDILGEERFNLLKLLDLGDIIWAAGTLFRTHTGEATLKVEDMGILAKSVRPMPVVKTTEEDGKAVLHDAISDAEVRYRQRYLDLMTNLDSRKIFRTRSLIISHLRRMLEEKGYLEVETPALQPLYGGANARPFVTYHHALNTRLYLRIADELYLKRLLVGGFERVYEIAKDFRNEGIDRTHYPEFTQLELYAAGGDYTTMMALCEELVAGIALKLYGTTKLVYQEQELDLTPPWKRLSIDEGLKSIAGIKDGLDAPTAEMVKHCPTLLPTYTPETPRADIIKELIEQSIEPTLWQPTFLCDYPREISPLAKACPHDPRVAERFEPFIAGIEIGNAFTEQNDPAEQRRLMTLQMDRKAKGDPEAQVLDEDFLTALEHGMPPTGGMGIGIDRLVMVLADCRSIRDVILFPQLADDKGERIKLAQEELEEHTRRIFGRKPSDAERRYYVPLLSGQVPGVSHEEALDHLRETLVDSTEALEHLKLELAEMYHTVLGRPPQEKEILAELSQLRDFGRDRMEILLKSKPEYQAEHPPMHQIQLTEPITVTAPAKGSRGRTLKLTVSVAGISKGRAFLAASIYRGNEKSLFITDKTTYGEDWGGETGKLSGEFNLRDHVFEIMLDRNMKPGEYQMLVGLWLDPYELPGAARTLVVSKLFNLTVK
jgi:lysyl-tRNA synthetase class 2